MVSKGKSVLRAQIEDTRSYLNYLMDLYPNSFNEWLKSKESECKQVARETADGDIGIECEIQKSLYSMYDYFENINIYFNDAMLIAVYAFYESTITRIAKKYNCTKNRLSDILKKNNINMGKNTSNLSCFLYCKIRVLRNQLCHNNMGTIDFSVQSILKAIVADFPEAIVLDDSSVHINKLSFVKDILEKEFSVLIELIKTLNL